MARREPALLVDELEELPDVLDVRVGEREVVVAPVHPLAEADRAFGQVAGRVDDDLAATTCELRQAEFLDLLLGVEPELALDAHLDPEALAVESVLVALVVPAQRLVALEDVLERAAPGGVDGERLVRRDRAVEEAEARAAGVQFTQSARRSPRAPRARESPARARRGRACPEGVRTSCDSRATTREDCATLRCRLTSATTTQSNSRKTERTPWQLQSRTTRSSRK